MKKPSTYRDTEGGYRQGKLGSSFLTLVKVLSAIGLIDNSLAVDGWILQTDRESICSIAPILKEQCDMIRTMSVQHQTEHLIQKRDISFISQHCVQRQHYTSDMFRPVFPKDEPSYKIKIILTHYS